MCLTPGVDPPMITEGQCLSSASRRLTSRRRGSAGSAIVKKLKCRFPEMTGHARDPRRIGQPMYELDVPTGAVSRELAGASGRWRRPSSDGGGASRWRRVTRVRGGRRGSLMRFARGLHAFTHRPELRKKAEGGPGVLVRYLPYGTRCRVWKMATTAGAGRSTSLLPPKPFGARGTAR